MFVAFQLKIMVQWKIRSIGMKNAQILHQISAASTFSQRFITLNYLIYFTFFLIKIFKKFFDDLFILLLNLFS